MTWTCAASRCGVGECSLQVRCEAVAGMSLAMAEGVGALTHISAHDLGGTSALAGASRMIDMMESVIAASAASACSG